MEQRFDFFACLEDFVMDMGNTFPDHKDTLTNFHKDTLAMENQKEQVKSVLKPIRSHARSILTYNPDMFEKPLVCFGGLDLSNVYHGAGPQTQFTIMRYLETMYIDGNIFLKPHKKEMFLKTVWNIKSKYKPQLPALPQVPEGAEIDDEAIQAATEQFQGMFGDTLGGEGGFMGDLLGDVASSVGNALKDNDPNEVLQKVFSGDMSMFEGMFKDMDQKYGDQLRGGENGDPAEAPDMSGLTDMLGGLMGGLMGGENGDGDGQQQGNPFAAMMAAANAMGGEAPGTAGEINPMGLMGLMQGMMGGGEDDDLPAPRIEQIEDDHRHFTTQSLERPQHPIPGEDIRDPPSDSDHN
jgi:hypothetical protein